MKNFWSKNKIVLIVVIILAILAAWFFGCEQGCGRKEKTTVPGVEQQKPVAIATFDSTAYYKGQLEVYKQLGQRHCGQPQKPAVVYRKVFPKQQKYQPPVQQTTQQPIQQQTVQPPVQQNVQQPTQTTQKTLDPIFYEGNSKIILFCVRLGQNQGRHLPHLAMINGERFGNSESNNQSGYNWHVARLSDGFSGEYGVTSDGVFFVSKSLIDRYICEDDNNIIEIKTTATGWAPVKMVLSGNYYTYKKK